jgi:hypothetical protein
LERHGNGVLAARQRCSGEVPAELAGAGNERAMKKRLYPSVDEVRLIFPTPRR